MTRPALAIDPRMFGRRMVVHEPAAPATPSMSADLRLFATTFAAGFVFVTVLIA
jgi:hypothetical protein